MQDFIDNLIRQNERAIPFFVYYLDGYDGERIVTYAPISVGDHVSVRLSDDETYLRKKKVKEIHHLDEVQNVGKQVLTTYITLED